MVLEWWVPTTISEYLLFAHRQWRRIALSRAMWPVSGELGSKWGFQRVCSSGFHCGSDNVGV